MMKTLFPKMEETIEGISKELTEAYKEFFGINDKVGETKEFVVELGKYKTTIKFTFSKSGYPMYNSHEVEISDKGVKLEALEKELATAVRARDFTKAAELQKKIDELNK